MATLHCTIEFDYEISDDKSVRVAVYGFADIEKCAKVDEAHANEEGSDDVLTLLDIASQSTLHVTITPKAPGVKT